MKKIIFLTLVIAFITKVAFAIYGNTHGTATNFVTGRTEIPVIIPDILRSGNDVTLVRKAADVTAPWKIQCLNDRIIKDSMYVEDGYLYCYGRIN